MGDAMCQSQHLHQLQTQQQQPDRDPAHAE
jgi:hypothetical protein